MIKVVLIPNVEPFTMVKGWSRFNHLIYRWYSTDKEMTLYKFEYGNLRRRKLPMADRVQRFNVLLPGALSLWKKDGSGRGNFWKEPLILFCGWSLKFFFSPLRGNNSRQKVISFFFVSVFHGGPKHPKRY